MKIISITTPCNPRGVQNFTQTVGILSLIVSLVFSLNLHAQERPQRPVQEIENTVVIQKTIVKHDLSVSHPAQSEINSSIESMPYYNYNGITDPELAKAAWYADQPKQEKPQKATPSVSANTGAGVSGTGSINSNNIISTPAKTQSNQTGEERMLPRDYDDSKTNTKKKN